MNKGKHLKYIIHNYIIIMLVWRNNVLVLIA